MGTKEMIKELELNYGYKFNPKEKHEFDWICDLIKDVETVVSKNESLHLVSNRDVFSDLRQLDLSSEQCSIVGAYIKSL